MAPKMMRRILAEVTSRTWQLVGLNEVERLGMLRVIGDDVVFDLVGVEKLQFAVGALVWRLVDHASIGHAHE
jgi:hypothetical protein